MNKNKRYRRYNTPIYIYDIGGILQGAGAAGGIIGAGISNAQIANTSGIQSNIDATKNYNVGASDYDSLMSEWSTISPISTEYNWKDIRGVKAGDMVSNTLGAIDSGAMAGAKASPWGAVIGGIAGLGSGIAGIFKGNKRAKEEAARLEAEAKLANMMQRNAFISRAEAIEDMMEGSLLANYGAKGGKINIKPSKRGTFTKAAKSRGLGVQEFASKVLANPDDYSEAMRKKAQFAKNASKWKHANGGPLFSDFNNGVIFINNGGTHEQNKYEGVQIGVDPQGVPNLVEEGEVIWQDYVFSNRLKPTKEFKDKYKLKGDTFADVAKQIQKESEERPNDPISKRGLEDSMMKLQIEQENIRMKSNQRNKGNKFEKGGFTLGDMYSAGIDLSIPTLQLPTNITSRTPIGLPNYTPYTPKSKSKTNYLRYAPVAGSLLGVVENLLNKPDYSSVETLMDEANKVGTYTPVSYSPIGNYMEYSPFDTNYYASKLASQAGATRRAVGNNPSRNAALLAIDYNTQSKLGDLYRQAEEYNLAQRQQAEEFNRSTNMANAEMALQVASRNQAAEQAAKSARLQGITKALAMKDAIDQQRESARSANITNLFDNLGLVGKEQAMIDMFNNNPYLLYEVLTGDYKRACGGKITKKRRK